MYLYGYGVEQNPVQALRMLREVGSHPEGRSDPQLQQMLAAVEGMFVGLPV